MRRVKPGCTPLLFGYGRGGLGLSRITTTLPSQESSYPHVSSTESILKPDSHSIRDALCVVVVPESCPADSSRSALILKVLYERKSEE